MSVASFTSSPPVEGSEVLEEESEKGAFLPMSLRGIVGRGFSLPEMTTCHHGRSSVSLLSSFGVDSSDPAEFFIEPHAYGGSGGDADWMDGEMLRCLWPCYIVMQTLLKTTVMSLASQWSLAWLSPLIRSLS